MSNEGRTNPLSLPDSNPADNILDSFNQPSEEEMQTTPPVATNVSTTNGKTTEEPETEDDDDTEDDAPDSNKPSTKMIILASIGLMMVACIIAGVMTLRKKEPARVQEPVKTQEQITEQITEQIPETEIPTQPPVQPVPTGTKPVPVQPPVRNTVMTMIVPNIDGQNAGIQKAVDELRNSSAKDITWLTNSALEPAILQTLREIKNKNARILVVCGKNALKENLQGVVSSGIPLLRSTNDLGRNTSFLIIDGKKLIDISNPELVWITVEKPAIQHVANWYWSQHKETQKID